MDHKETCEQLKLKNQLCFPLYACAKEVVRVYTPFLEPLGLTYTQYLVMLALWERDTVSVKSLGDLLWLDSGTLTPLLKKLESKGCVTRTRSLTDERCVEIRLTDEGKAMRERAAEIPSRVASCLRIPHDEAAALYDLLYRTLNSLSENENGAEKEEP